MNPEFFHINADEIPTWEEDGVQFKLIAGEAFHRKSPVPVYSKLYMLELKNKTKKEMNFANQLYGESGLYILEGAIESEGNIYGPKQMLIAKDSSLCSFNMHPNSTIYLFGGEAFPEERYIDWNFVSSDKEKIAEAKQKWIEHKFDKIKGEENDYIPYPSFNK
jgi:redox-sensitive bicupin YhaK (pirin superfamily)